MMMHPKFIALSFLAAILCIGGYVFYLQQKTRVEYQAQRFDILRSFASHLSLDLDDIHRTGSELSDFQEHIQDDLPRESMLIVRDRVTKVPALVAIGEHFPPAYAQQVDWLNLAPNFNEMGQDHGLVEWEGTRLLWYNTKVAGSPWVISILLVEFDSAMGYAYTLLTIMLTLGIAALGYLGYQGTQHIMGKIGAGHSKELSDATKLDSLTELPNRARFTELLNRAITSATNHRKTLAVCLIGINHFKRFNDALGNAGGDDILREFANRVRQVIRANDIAARCGGDEFGLILHDVDRHGALAAMQNIITAVEKYFTIGKQTYLATARAGVALFPDHGTNGQMLLHQADTAMRAAKKEGAKVVLYQSIHAEQSNTVVALSADLREAILRDKLELHYQPKYDLNTNRVCGAEALLRWPHPIRGSIPPLEFIEVAEHAGLIKQLTYWVIDQAFQDYQRFAQLIPEFKVAINLSVTNLQDPQLVDEIATLVNKHQVWPANFIFEITESAVMVNVSQIVTSLRALHITGFGVSVDDFGTGYTSFLNLKHLPIGEIKIDRSFVGNLMSEREDASIVQATIDLGRALGIAVVAEGVEDAPTLERLRAAGCHYVQGYFISKPTPLDDFTRWLQKQISFENLGGSPRPAADATKKT